MAASDSVSRGFYGNRVIHRDKALSSVGLSSYLNGLLKSCHVNILQHN